MPSFPADFDQFLKIIQNREPVKAFENDFKNAIHLAAQNPQTLYLFFARYNYLNAQIASTIASLVGNIGKSRNAFIDPAIAAKSEADFSFEVADLVNEASHNEYGDPEYQDIHTGAGVSHRLLATGLLKSIGNYAELTDDERNEFETPKWLEHFAGSIQAVYSGRKDHLFILAKAMGAHVFSEWSADNIEFSNAAIELFINGKNQGFHAYTQDHPNITVQGKTFLAISWLKTHGGYNETENRIEHGVEYEHLETGFKAIQLVMEKLHPHDKDIFEQGVFEGISQCRKLLNAFFVNAGMECKYALENIAAFERNHNINEHFSPKAF